MHFAGGSERLGSGAGSKQQVLEAGLGDFLQAPPLLDRDKNRGLNPSLGNDLQPFRHACGKELAEAGLGLLNLPYFAHDRPSWTNLTGYMTILGRIATAKAQAPAAPAIAHTTFTQDCGSVVREGIIGQVYEAVRCVGGNVPTFRRGFA